MKRLLEPGEIAAAPTPEMAPVRLPVRERVFADRAQRLRSLAAGHSMADYLAFVAALAEVQQATLGALPPIMLPTPAHIEQCRAHAMPPLNGLSHHRDRAWCDLVRMVCRRIATQSGGRVAEIATRLERERDELYEAQASKLLAGITLGLDLGYAPLIGAALQVYWVHLTTTLGVDSFGAIDTPTVCPCCGARPLASIVRSGAGQDGHRFLHCSLCAGEWPMVRIQCASCESNERIAYHAIDGSNKAVQAESCDACGTYLKIFTLERDPGIEPTADDLASLALDLLMDQTGKFRSSQNLMLIHGDGE